MLKIADGNSVSLLFDRSNVVTDGSATSKVAIELSVRFSVVRPCRVSVTELSESVILVIVFLFRLSVTKFLFAMLPNCEGKLPKLQFSMVSNEIVVGKKPVGSDPRSKLVKINCSNTVAVANVSSSNATDFSDPFCTFVSSNPVIWIFLVASAYSTPVTVSISALGKAAAELPLALVVHASEADGSFTKTVNFLATELYASKHWYVHEELCLTQSFRDASLQLDEDVYWTQGSPVEQTLPQ